MIHPGTVVTVEFPGAHSLKRRPAVVVSTPTYHMTRPDVLLGLLTSQLSSATGPRDYLLHDWSAAGLHTASAFRAFFATLPATAVSPIGQLSGRDWQAVQARLHIALAVE